MGEAVNVGGHDARHVVKARRWGILGLLVLRSALKAYREGGVLGGGSLDKVPRWACSVSPCTVKFVMLEADLPRSVRLARSEEMLMVVPEGLLLAFQPGRFQAA